MCNKNRFTVKKEVQMFHNIIFNIRFFVVFLTISMYSAFDSMALENSATTDKQPFSIDETTSGISISNGIIGLKFFKDDGFGLYSIKNMQKDHDFMPGEMKGSTLWKIEFKHASNRIVKVDNNAECIRSYTIEKSADGTNLTLHLYWKGITLDTEEKSLNVEATVRLDTSSLSYWQINVENNSKKFGTWEVTYPSINRLSAIERDDMQLAYPDFIGCLLKNPVKRIAEKIEDDPRPPQVMSYPSARCNMQFSTLFEGKNNNGLYLATHDPKANVKKFGYDVDEKDKSLKYSLRNYPEGMGIPGSQSSYRMPYEAVVGVYEGDWITASKIYREWVVNQKWCAKGRLSQRNDIPRWYLNTPIWFVSWTEGLATNKLIPLAKFLDVPTILQWYGWTENPFDTYYPDYFPPIEGFSKMAKQMQNAGVKIVPYINSRIWDMNSKSWSREHPESATTKTPFVMFDDLISYSKWNTCAWQDLAIVKEHWADNPFAVMCPTTKVWQNKLAEVVTRMVSELGANGVYMDQTASCQPAYCFDPLHGHPLGGGHHWIDGNRKGIEQTHESARKVNPEIILTTEDFAEPYIDVFDGLLACNIYNIFPDHIPLFDFVYSGYCLLYGQGAGGSALSFKMGNARMFIWGQQMGWFDPNSVNLESPEAKYLKVLCKSLAKESVRKFLFFGEMVRPPKLEGDNPMLQIPLGADQKKLEMAAVSHSAWKGEDGTLGLVFTNLDSVAHSISYKVDYKELKLVPSKKYSVKVIDGSGAGTEKIYSSDSFLRKEKMAAGSVLVLEIKGDSR